MASRLLEQVDGAGAQLMLCVAEHGSAAHAWFAGAPWAKPPHAGRNLADALHFLCMLHGRHPGVVELAASRVVDPAARAWLADAAEAMAEERRLLAHFSVAAGPMPSTPGSHASEAAITAQRGALATLALSDRAGCALGAALAFASDWAPIRGLLEAASKRFGVDLPPSRFGDPAELRLVADIVGESPAVERAMLFGAAQLCHQHRGLWDLLEAREQARSGT